MADDAVDLTLVWIGTVAGLIRIVARGRTVIS